MNTIQFKDKLSGYLNNFKKLKNLFIFSVFFFGMHFLWKWLVDGNMEGQEISICGFDCTPFFYDFSRFTASVCYHIARWCGISPLVIEDTWIRYYGSDLGGSVNIIWGCTGFKQLLMFLIPMIFTPGDYRKKLWFIPLGLLVVWFFNIFRIVFILYKTGIDFNEFHYWHFLFNHPYYIVIFLLWVIWEELINSPKDRYTA